ncbi:MAG: protein translocase subunit SecD [Gammaproteobacteria bacterium]|nr:protein translocase subunit SecD [Gammaproteobacteria bacterium]
MILNKYPLWKNLLVIFILLFSILYSLPNVFGEDPAVQISGIGQAKVDAALLAKVKETMRLASLSTKSIKEENHTLLIRCSDVDVQLKIKDQLKTSLGDNYSVALNLASASPHWLSLLGASPMKLGLDLRGGVHFTLAVDLPSVINQSLESTQRSMETELREANIRYLGIVLQKGNQLSLLFRDQESTLSAITNLKRHFPQFVFSRDESGKFIIQAELTPAAVTEIHQRAIEQTMTTLRNRVNELGVSEAMVQQQGSDRIAVDLPGVQDTARAKEILGGTATLEFKMMDVEHDVRTALSGHVIPGSKLYPYEERAVLLKNQIILTGTSITDASSGFGEDGRAAVNIRLGGGGEGLFRRVTSQNIGKPMAIVFVETKMATEEKDGQMMRVAHKKEHVISVATIRSALPNNFQITGLSSQTESRDLALMLRAGALPAAIDFVEERTIGPQLGAENIQQGINALLVGMVIIVLFMGFYYRLFGVIADIALLANLLLLVALLSVLGATLTLPGIAGIVLTLGMAVDANVLIFERIREEWRNGTTLQKSIHAGYERAFSTILDANITTLIVSFVLFGLGTGPIKGFAITLSLGIITSMLTGIFFARAMVNKLYGGRQVHKLSIGI